ncbi:MULTISPECIES: M48 family metalloprotease [Sphingomonas]|jgi:predicted Zn-dependent protease|uniref:M48 family metalloprotease n=1 Tax=Sphingomonas TaxID=13687 RepID=UPI001AE24649
MKRLFAGLAASLLIWAQPAAAQSILRDAETEAMFNDMSRPLILAAGLSPNNVRVVLINDDSINAFTAGGQTIYVNSGLIQAADNANQVQGVIAHELGHVADGHVVLIGAGARPAMGISILSMVLGLAAIAAGAPEAGAGILSAGTTAAEGKFLAFSRVQESTADATGAKFLRESGLSGKGMLSFFKKLANEEYAYGLKNIDPFAQSHPLSGERIANLTADVTASPFYNAKPDLALDDRFKRVKAKLLGYVADPKTTLNVYPEEDQSVYAHYARAYAWHKSGYPEKADAEAAALLKAAPHDPYFLEIQGQILLEAGKPRQALTPLREATELSRNAPLIATTFGHALIATEDKANYPEAIKVLRQAVARDDDNPFAWYQLGTAYEASGDQPRALLATAEQASLTGDHRTAAYSARGAMQGLPPNSVDWIRAQDIALSAQNEMDDNPKKYKKRR